MPAVVTTFTKTPGGVLLPLTQVASGSIVIGAALNVASAMAGLFLVKLGRATTAAFTNEMRFRFEGSAKAAGNDEWYPLLQWSSAFGKTAANNTTLNGATTAGNTTSVLALGTGFVVGAYAYFRETGVPANSEWSRVLSLSSNTVTFEEAQTRSHTTGISVTNISEVFSGDVDLSAITRVRLVVDAASAPTGQTVDILGYLNTLDSTSSA